MNTSPNSKTENQSTMASARSFLAPLSGLFGFGIGIRNFCFDKNLLSSYRPGIPVVCSGNVTVGGSGKTPFTAYLAKELICLGKKPVILSRGYRGRIQGPKLVSPTDTPADVGDEALLHCQSFGKSVAVVISKKRSLGAKFIEEHSLGDIILLDDGYQHRRLERDLNFLLLDVSTEESIERWKNGRLMPVGYLRETFSQAISRANALIFVNRNTSTSKDVAYLGSSASIPDTLASFSVSLSPSSFVDIVSGKEFPLNHFAGTQGSALTAIAGPKSFFSMLGEQKIVLAHTQSFRDHHDFSQNDWKSFRSRSNGPVFTTTKDAVKLRRFVESEESVYTMNLDLVFSSSSQEERFWQLISTTLTLEERCHEKPFG